MYCRRKGWALDSVSARYEHDRVHARDCDDCESDASGYIDRVRSQIFIEGDFDDEQRSRLTETARRCPVHKTLERGVTFTSEAVTDVYQAIQGFPLNQYRNSENYALYIFALML